jgi:Uncharacterized protein conserved in bacteria
MKKSRQLIGIRIMDKKTGKLLGKIKNCIFYPDSVKIKGFVVDCGRWVKNEKVLLISNIYKIGKDMVIADCSKGLTNIDSIPDIKKFMNEKERISGLPVITSDGDEIGYIEDIIIDEHNFTIEGYVITDGIVEDITKGKAVIPSSQSMVFGEDAVLISSGEKLTLRNDISIKKYLNGEKVNNT